MRFLRSNTACRITVGPFMDKTDGVTPEVALTVTSCKLTLMVDDGNVPTLVLDVAPTASGGANDMVHVTGDDAGFYDLELAAANVNYLGRAMLAITDPATHCPVFHEFVILPAMIYDALILGTDRLDVNTTHLADQAITAAAGITFPSSIASPTNITAGTITTVTNLTNLPAITANWLTAAGTAADFATELRTAINGGDYPLNTAADGSIRFVDGVGTGELDTLSGTVLLRAATQASIAAIEVDTNELQMDWVNGGRLDLILDARASQTSVDDLPTNAELAARTLAAADYFDPATDTVVNVTNVASVFSVTVNPLRLVRTTIAVVNSQTEFTLTVGTDENDAYNGLAITLEDATDSDQKCMRTVLDYVGSTKTITLDSAPTFTIAVGDTTAILSHAGLASIPTVAQVQSGLAMATDLATVLADTNELQTDWADGGRLDLILDAAGSAGDPWTTVLPGAYTSGQAGNIIGNLLASLATAHGAGSWATATGFSTLTQSDITGGAYPLSTNASGMVRHVVGTGVGELDSGSGLVSSVVSSLSGTAQGQILGVIAAYDPPTNAEMIAAIPTAAQNADAVWLELIAAHSGTAGSAAEALSAAGGAGDPWITALPGAYSAGQAGNIIGNLLSSLSTTHGAGSWTTATGFSTHSAADVWSVVTRVLTDGTNIVLAKGIGITGFTDLSAADVRTAVGLATPNLDTQLDNIPTNAELALRTLLSAEYATEVTQQTILGHVDTEIAALVAAIATINAINAKTTNLPVNPAAVTDIPTTAAIKTAMEVDGGKLDHLWEMTENDGGVRRLTANALEQAPAGGGGGGATTLVLSASAPILQSISSAGEISIHRGDSFTVQLTDLGDISNRSKLWITVREEPDDDDSLSVFQIEETAGLLFLESVAVVGGVGGNLTVDDAVIGDITVSLTATAAAELLRRERLHYDIQVLRNTGAVNTLAQGKAKVTGDITRAIS